MSGKTPQEQIEQTILDYAIILERWKNDLMSDKAYESDSPKKKAIELLSLNPNLALTTDGTIYANTKDQPIGHTAFLIAPYLKEAGR